MQTSPEERKNYHKAFMWLVVVAGLFAVVDAAIHFPLTTVDLAFLFLAGVTIVLGSRIGVEFSRHRVQVTASDIFVFLTLLLYGGEAAVLVAALEAFSSSCRFSKLWVTRFFNSALLAVSTYLSYKVVVFLFGSPVELTTAPASPTFVAAIFVLALVQYLSNSLIAAIRQALKLNEPVWKTWKDYFLWTGVTYSVSASAASVTAELIAANGFYAFFAVVPIVCIIYFTYESYRKQIDAKTEQARQAEEHAREQERISHELRQSEEHFRGAFDYAAVGMALLANNGRWLRVNPSFCKLVGYTESELLETDFQSITHPNDLGNSLADLYKMNERKIVTFTSERRYVHKEGHDVWTIISVSAVKDAAGNQTHLIMQAQDITERKKAEERLHHAAFFDSLTSLPNRRLLTQHLQLAIDKSKGSGHQYALLFLDVDRFKNINDSLGHVIGDQVLMHVARRLENCLGGDDMVARFGGDEFAVLINGLHSSAEAISAAERIQTELAAPFNVSGHEVFCGASIGVALASSDYSQSEEILRDADTAMYRAKEHGKGRFEVFDKNMHARAMLRLQLENDLRRAVDRDEFEVHYQPIVDLQTGCLSGFESLVRWRHPERGLVSPAEFILVAEETDLIIPLGHWVLLESCRQVKEWQTKWSFPKPLTISVNLSGKQFKQADLVERIKQILYQTKLEPGCLRLEITESIVMDDAEAAIAMLRQIRSLGVQLSIDDFGTGYSSLSYLHRFPVNILKVDRSFVSRMAVDEESLGIVETVIALAAKLKMKVVAEGVETAGQSEQLREFKCDYGQGYLFSKPLPVGEAEEFIRNSASAFSGENKIASVKISKTIEATDPGYTM